MEYVPKQPSSRRVAFWDSTTRAIEISEALEISDDARLATAIHEAEAHNTITHAARMRIVLAQRTRDRTQLDRARPVLERLGDRRSFRRLEHVAAELGTGEEYR
jgi:hypothetical protein